MKRSVICFLLIVGGVINTLCQTVTVNLTSTKQVIKGFGGINHPSWYSDLNTQERDLCFGNGTGQLGLTVLRTFVSDKSSEWGLGMATAQRAQTLGATIFSTPCNPPTGMYITVNGVKRINPATYADYANHLNSYVTYMKNNGVNIYAISVQNEPDYADQWTEWSPQEAVDFIKGYGSKINCKLMTPESFQYKKTLYDPILNDAAALANVAIFGTHLYGTQYKDFPYPLFTQKGAGKELWMTEVYTDSKYDANIWDDAYINDSRHALKVAEHIHYAMVEGQFQTYVYWPIRRFYALIHDGNSDGQGSTPAAAGTATKRGYCMAQYSKWVRPGYIRVDATANPLTNVFVSAYKNNGDVVIVAVNKNTSAKAITFSVPGTVVTSWENYTTSASKNIAKGTTITANDNFQVTLEASSVTTFVGKASSEIPVVTIDAPTTNVTYQAPASVAISAKATVATGSVSKLQFYNGTTLIGEDASAPYSYTWTNVPVGTYTIRVVAVGSSGKTGEASVAIKVNPAQAPYGGIAWAVPGKIEFENYDIGGNGFAYVDSTAGSATTVAFRTDEDVDIENCTDVGTGYNIGYATAGEWLEYTVNVAKAGKYDLTLRAACNADSRTVTISAKDVVVAKNIAIPNTTAWQVWTDVTVKDIGLDAGTQVIRVTIGASDYVNLNYMTFTAQSQQAPSVSLKTGWNLVGYPLEGSADIATALTSIWSNVEVVKDLDAYYMKSQAAALNSLKKLEWGKGYLIKVSAPCTIVW